MKRKTIGWLIFGGGLLVALLLGVRKSYAEPDWEAKIFLAKLSPYQSIVKTWAYHWSLLNNVVRALIWTESSGDPNAESEKGAKGLMGILYPTAQEMGFAGEPDELFDPNTNLYYGGKYLRWQLDRYGQDLQKALTAYYAGTYTPEYQWYVDRVLGYYSRLTT